MAMPPSNTAPLRDPASRRTAEWVSRCHGEASSAQTPAAAHAKDKVAAKPSAARRGTITTMERLYRQVRRQTIELLVMPGPPRSLIDRTAAQYQDAESA